MRRGSKQTIAEFLRGTGVEIRIGAFLICQLKDGSYWLENGLGEGAQVQAAVFEAELERFFREVF